MASMFMMQMACTCCQELLTRKCILETSGQPEKEDLFTGSRAAASGGVTSFLDMPNNVPSQTTLQSMYDKLDTASKNALRIMASLSVLRNQMLKN